MESSSQVNSKKAFSNRSQLQVLLVNSFSVSWQTSSKLCSYQMFRFLRNNSLLLSAVMLVLLFIGLLIRAELSSFAPMSFTFSSFCQPK
jgi:hypothetical protein